MPVAPLSVTISTTTYSRESYRMSPMMIGRGSGTSHVVARTSLIFTRAPRASDGPAHLGSVRRSRSPGVAPRPRIPAREHRPTGSAGPPETILWPPRPVTLAAPRGSNVPRILIGGYQHEGHSFVPGVLSLDDMATSGYVVEGPEMLTTAIGDDHEVSGAIDVARAAGVELIPTAHAWGGVGPAIEDAAYRFFEDRILAGLRAERGRIDGVYLPLHGASITTASEDPEGDLLTAVRGEVGPDIPVVASFDLHAHTTERMVAAADALIPYTTCPHIDFRATGQRAMTLLLDAVAGRVRPVTRQRKLRLMASAEKHDTNHGPMVGVMSLARAMETRPGILAVGVTPTQPWLDLSELGWSAIVVADGDPDLAQTTADELAWTIWERRESYRVVKVPVAEAVETALAARARPVILAEGADSPSAGGFGDGNDLLVELLRRGDTTETLLTIADPVAARAAVAAGVGATVRVTLGGAFMPSFYTPVEVEAKVA